MILRRSLTDAVSRVSLCLFTSFNTTGHSDFGKLFHRYPWPLKKPTSFIIQKRIWLLYIYSKRYMWWQNSCKPLLQSYRWMGKGPHTAFAAEEHWDQPDWSVPKLNCLRIWRIVFPYRNWHWWGCGRQSSWQRTQKVIALISYRKLLSWCCWPGDIWLWIILYYKSQAPLLISNTPILGVCVWRFLLWMFNPSRLLL